MIIFYKRLLLFLFLCIPIRILMVLLVKHIDKKFLPYLGIIGLLPAIGFSIIYLGNYRKTGPETFGKKIWWNNLRPIHALLYFLFSYLALQKNKDSWKPLLIDVVIGVNSFILFHSMNAINS